MGYSGLYASCSENQTEIPPWKQSNVLLWTGAAEKQIETT